MTWQYADASATTGSGYRNGEHRERAIGNCGCCGDYTFIFADRDGRDLAFSLHHGSHVRCRDLGGSDAPVASEGLKHLVDFFRSHGIALPQAPATDP